MNPQVENIPEASRVEIIRCLAEKVQAAYVFPEVAERICANLQEHLLRGDYSGEMDAELFALALTIHMQEVCQDEHLWVRWHPDTLPSEEDQLRLNREWQEQQRLQATLDNFGFQKVERLPGNIGLLDIHYFHRPEWSTETASAAMTLLAHTSALVIDLRKCSGGYPGMVAGFASHFFGEEPLLLGKIYWHDENRTQEFWSQPCRAGERYEGKPVFLLTSRATFSAGEGFASILQGRKKARIIGDKTDGGSHPGVSYRIHPHYEAFIPVGRSIDPLTGKDWEGTGLLPDIQVPQEQAFSAAYYLALREVQQGLGQIQAGASQTLAQEIQDALVKLEAGKRFCQRCGYPNATYLRRCKNCDTPLPEGNVSAESG